MTEAARLLRSTAWSSPDPAPIAGDCGRLTAYDGGRKDPYMLVVARPAADLAGRIEMIWSRGPDATPGRAFHEFFPDSSANLIFRWSSAGARLVLLGPVTEQAAVELDGGSEYLGVRFRTGQTPLLANVLPAELTNAHVELTSLGGISLDLLAERLSSASDMPSRQLVVEDLVRGARPLARDVRGRRAASLVEAHGGQLRVDDLAKALGLSVRSLERLCVEQLGMGPKRLGRLVRLRQVLVRLQAGNFGTLADLAHACGYSDQPHLNRDFKHLTGRLPGEKDAFQTRQIAGAPQTTVVHRYRGPVAAPP
jgi:AraC-like DNA-binding protein